MRAIDADALIDDLKHDVAVDQDSLDYEELTDLNRENIQFDKDCKQNAIDLLQHAPTIEPQRKKGKWLPDNNSVYEMRFVCSECKESQVVPTIGFTKYKPIWDFCPNCGADMTEKSEEPKKCDTCRHVKSQWFNRCADCSDYELWESKE